MKSNSAFLLTIGTIKMVLTGTIIGVSLLVSGATAEANDTIVQCLREGNYREVVAAYDTDSATTLATFDTCLVGAYAFALSQLQRETEAFILLENVTA